MANHCWNHARITGRKAELDLIEQRIEREAKKSPDHILWWDTFKNIIPKGYFDFESNNVYEEFGSKWFSPNVERETDESLVVSGDSAWSPVNEFFRKISKVFNVHIDQTYEEPGMNFGGWFECRNGKVTRDDQVSYLFFINTEDPGRAFEEIFFTVEDGIFKNEEDVKENYGKDYDLLTEDQKNRIREFFNTKKKI